MENIHSMHYLTKQITDKEKCVCFPPVKLYLRTESEVAELAGQTNSPPSPKATRLSATVLAGFSNSLYTEFSIS